MTSYRTNGGIAVTLGASLGRGGEGAVFSIQGDANTAAKIYLGNLASSRRAKISGMVASKLYASSSFISYPIATLVDEKGEFRGFTMRLMAGRKPAHQLYSPTGRKSAFPRAAFPMLVRTASNIARAVNSVHLTGCIIGDINHSGVLVSDDATVVLIDSDSFQFKTNGVLYPCKVGVPEFTPPELQGKDLSLITRTVNHDNFGLAILIFYTLMMGRHPFAGRFLGNGDMPMDRAIAEYRFAYSARRSSTLMDPPPNVPTLSDLPLAISDAFEQAFGPSGSGGKRPSASEWVSILDRAEGELVDCTASSSHKYFRVAKSCPWCRMEAAYPGFLAFSPVFPIGIGQKPLDLRQLIAAVRAVGDPGPAPDLTTIMPPRVVPSSNTGSDGIRRKKFRRRLIAVAGFALGLSLLTVAPPGPIIALITIMGSSAVYAMQPTEAKDNYKRTIAAQSAWDGARKAFQLNAGNSDFKALRQQCDDLISRIQSLNSEEADNLKQLADRKRDVQFRHFLEQYDIVNARIKGVGVARKLTLKSYGIETAADVIYSRITAISGFGPTTANSIVAWRRQVEAGFHFNPSQAIDPSDIAIVRNNIVSRRLRLEGQAQQAITLLQKMQNMLSYYGQVQGQTH